MLMRQFPVAYQNIQSASPTDASDETQLSSYIKSLKVITLCFIPAQPTPVLSLSLCLPACLSLHIPPLYHTCTHVCTHTHSPFCCFLSCYFSNLSFSPTVLILSLFKKSWKVEQHTASCWAPFLVASQNPVLLLNHPTPNVTSSVSVTCS